MLSCSKHKGEALFFASCLNAPVNAKEQHQKKKEPAYLSREDFNWDGEKDVWKRLANAVIIQAEMDWREAVQRLKENPDDEEAKTMLKDAEAFFLSEDYLMFTHYDGKTLLNRLKREQPESCRFSSSG